MDEVVADGTVDDKSVDKEVEEILRLEDVITEVTGLNELLAAPDVELSMLEEIKDEEATAVVELVTTAEVVLSTADEYGAEDKSDGEDEDAVPTSEEEVFGLEEISDSVDDDMSVEVLLNSADVDIGEVEVEYTVDELKTEDVSLTSEVLEDVMLDVESVRLDEVAEKELLDTSDEALLGSGMEELLATNEVEDSKL